MDQAGGSEVVSAVVSELRCVTCDAFSGKCDVSCIIAILKGLAAGEGNELGVNRCSNLGGETVAVKSGKLWGGLGLTPRRREAERDECEECFGNGA